MSGYSLGVSWLGVSSSCSRSTVVWSRVVSGCSMRVSRFGASSSWSGLVGLMPISVWLVFLMDGGVGEMSTGMLLYVIPVSVSQGSSSSCVGVPGVLSSEMVLFSGVIGLLSGSGSMFRTSFSNT